MLGISSNCVSAPTLIHSRPPGGIPVRGKGGGICLARPAAQISVGSVVREIEGHFQLAECFDPKKQGNCAIQSQCGLTALLGNAIQQFFNVLDNAVLTDLVLPGAVMRSKGFNMKGDAAG